MIALSNTAIEFGEIAEQRADYIEAAAAYTAALGDPDPLIAAEAQFRLGRVAWRQGDFDRAFAGFDFARSVSARHGASELRARAEIGIGNVHYGRGAYAQARQSYATALSFSVDSRSRAVVLLNMGAIANIEGDLEEAERCYRESQAGFHEVDDANGESQAFHNLGMLHADRLEWTAADQSYAQCITLCEQTGNRELIGQTWMNRSELSCAMGRYAEAVSRCDVALGLFAEIGAEVHRGTTLRWKGRALRELNQYPMAERALYEAMRIAHRSQAKLLEAEVVQELASTVALSGDYTEARRWYERALILFNELGATREAGEIRADIRALDDR
jgi:tetratricopeptide (TPR) repeat protein